MIGRVVSTVCSFAVAALVIRHARHLQQHPDVATVHYLYATDRPAGAA